MAFVDDDQIEELGEKLLERFVGFLRPGDRLIEREVNLVGRIELVSGDFRHRTRRTA